MYFQSFHEKFPAIAEAETRTVTLLDDNVYSLPANDYIFVEMFCNTRKCDCRRVMFTVFSGINQQVEAVIAWGWEARDFYKKWLGYYDKDEITELIGPSLNVGSPQSLNAPQLLILFKDILLSDAEYCNRVKKHYLTFKKMKK